MTARVRNAQHGARDGVGQEEALAELFGEHVAPQPVRHVERDLRVVAPARRHDRLDRRDLDLGRAQRRDRRREADDRPEQRAEERKKGGARDARALALGERRVFAEGHGRRNAFLCTRCPLKVSSKKNLRVRAA